MSSEIKRQTLVALFSATNSNPNGDPRCGNLPRRIPHTGHGLFTDVSLKRKVRDTLKLYYGRRIWTDNDEYLKQKIDRYLVKGTGKTTEGNDEFSRAIFSEYIDARLFGGMWTFGAGTRSLKFTAPVNVSMFQSVCPIRIMDNQITRVCKTNPPPAKKESKKKTDDDDLEMESNSSDNVDSEFGQKPIIAHGLYRGIIEINPFLGEKTFLTQEDIDLFLEVLPRVYELTTSTIRPEVSMIGLHCFTHDDRLGSATRVEINDLVQVNPLVDVPTCVGDYQIEVLLDRMKSSLTYESLYEFQPAIRREPVAMAKGSAEKTSDLTLAN